jgi:hypothetical protein
MGVMLLCGCASQEALVYDSSYPKARQSTILIDGPICIWTMDGDTVNWGRDSGKKLSVSIPSGKHEFVAYVGRRNGLLAFVPLLNSVADLTSETDDYQFSYDFLPSRTYALKSKSHGLGFGKNTVEVKTK